MDPKIGISSIIHFLNIGLKVMEMINKNMSMDFEALKKHARMNYWHMDEVGLVEATYQNT